MSDIVNYNEQTFESIKHINGNGQEFWHARELQFALDYSQWRRFHDVIERAKIACENSGNSVEEHFAEVGKTIEMPKNAQKEILDFELSRYACYLIVMNGDSRKEVIAVGQTYFAVKTRQQELIENYENLDEDQKRLAIRNENSQQIISGGGKECRNRGLQRLCDFSKQRISRAVWWIRGKRFT